MDTPHLAEAPKGNIVVDVACGSSHSACILDVGSMYTWGKGRYGRLGHNDHETVQTKAGMWVGVWEVCMCVRCAGVCGCACEVCRLSSN